MKTCKLFLLIFIAGSFALACDKDEDISNPISVDYPEFGKYGTNLLDSTQTDYFPGYCSMSAILGQDASIKVKIKGHPWWFDFQQVYTSWAVSGWNNNEMSREFTSIITDTIDAEIQLVSGVGLEIYVWENGDSEATWAKRFVVH